MAVSDIGTPYLRKSPANYTGHTAAWVVYSVSQAPKVEAKVVEELRSLDLLATDERPTPRPIQWEDVAKLTYLNSVIKARPEPRKQTLSTLTAATKFAVLLLPCLDDLLWRQ